MENHASHMHGDHDSYQQSSFMKQDSFERSDPQVRHGNQSCCFVV